MYILLIESGSEASGDSLDKKDSGIPYKVEYQGIYGNPSNVDAWKNDADKNLYRRSAEYDELNYVPKVSGSVVHDGKHDAGKLFLVY